ncbi:MAG: hypothetical protein K9G76_10590 [Bacteroidales bacterium]|nr:hypothetical protein [Bacteroidales bacterium]MCF8404216.1 hypothetical protein [Bacteroidales bacterium]
MKKTEIIQLTFIVLGILIIVRTILATGDQLSMMIKYWENPSSSFEWVIPFVIVFLVLLSMGYILIRNSRQFANRVIMDEEETGKIVLQKSDIFQISLVILCLYFIVTLFPAFISTAFYLLVNFFNDFALFKEIWQQQIWTLLLYIFLFISLLYSRKFSIWLEKKLVV